MGENGRSQTGQTIREGNQSATLFQTRLVHEIIFAENKINTKHMTNKLLD